MNGDELEQQVALGPAGMALPDGPPRQGDDALGQRAGARESTRGTRVAQ
jgi:hypothetical protein